MYLRENFQKNMLVILHFCVQYLEANELSIARMYFYETPDFHKSDRRNILFIHKSEIEKKISRNFRKIKL